MRRLQVFLLLLRHPHDPAYHWVLPIFIRRLLNGFMRKRGNRATDA